MKNLLVITSALLLTCAAAAAHADTVTYTVTVNTSSQSGNTGYIDLGLNASTLPSDDVIATLSGFSGASLNSSDPNNSIVPPGGSLADGLSLDSQVGNDYFEALTFGSSVSFQVMLSGAGVGTSGPGLDSQTDFQVAFYDSAISEFLFSDEPGGSAVLISVAADQAPDVLTPDTTVAATPEPATLSLLGLGGVAVGFARRWRPRAA